MQELDKIKLIALIFLLIINASCIDKQSKKNSSIYKVKLAFEPDFYNTSRIDTVEFSKPKITDTANHSNELTNYVGNEFFKVDEGELEISAVSLFERKYSKTINVNSDTTIIFKKNDFPIVFNEMETWDEDLNLKSIDTVVIYSFNGSCFTTDAFASVRKISCFKNDTDYWVKFTDLPRGSANNRLTYKTKKKRRIYKCFEGILYCSKKGKRKEARNNKHKQCLYVYQN